MTEPEDKAHEALGLAIDSELEQGRDRGASLEQRAMAVVTTSGVLVSLVFGFGTLLRGKEIRLPEASRILLIPALISFVAAAIVSLQTIRPRNYPVESDWKNLLSSWIKSPGKAWESITNLHLEEIRHWHETNTIKAKYLIWAIVAECMGISLLAASILALTL